jgi:uracil phosphoribosyltransferase
MVFEITKDLPTRKVQIDTPLEKAHARTLKRKLVIVSILRAGLGMQEPFLRIFPEAKVGHLGFYRNEKTLQPVKYYAKLPAITDDTTVILCDPMLATGGSLNAAIGLLKSYGAEQIKCFTLVAAPQGVRTVFKLNPDVEIHTAALDRELNERGYILPGLGDAGDRQFGTY